MTSPQPVPERALESAPASDEATQLLVWRPPARPPTSPRTAPAYQQRHVPVDQQRHLSEPDPSADRRGLIVVVVVALLVATALVLTVWLSAPSHTPGPGWR